MNTPRYITQSVALYDSQVSLGLSPGRAMIVAETALARTFEMTREQARDMIKGRLDSRTDRVMVDTGVL